MNQDQAYQLSALLNYQCFVNSHPDVTISEERRLFKDVRLYPPDSDFTSSITIRPNQDLEKLPKDLRDALMALTLLNEDEVKSIKANTSITLELEGKNKSDVETLALKLGQYHIETIEKEYVAHKKELVAAEQAALQAMRALGELSNNAHYDKAEAKQWYEKLGAAYEQTEHKGTISEITDRYVKELKLIAEKTNRVLGNSPDAPLMLTETAIKNMQRSVLSSEKSA